jgi:hypothetical protein
MREKKRKHRQMCSKKNMDMAVRNYYWELEEKGREKDSSDIWIHVLVWAIAGIMAFIINPALFWFIAIVAIIFSFKSEPSPKLKKDDNSSAEKIEGFDNGTAFDSVTGLTWCRYSVGQDWQQGKVVGEATKIDYYSAMNIADSFNKNKIGGFSDWRVPTLDELKSIVKKDTSPTINSEIFPSAPTINSEIFPNTPTDIYWSSSPCIEYIGKAWQVGFGYGRDHVGGKKGRRAVRLVRGIQHVKRIS